MNNLILLELNELNFDVARNYIDAGVSLPGFHKMESAGLITTEAEIEYENLEPWIQWPSVHTGKKFKEHKIFRLGDFVNCTDEQFFEKVESAGFKVGAVSPMNASNKLKNPAYFIPDPWTVTASDGSFLSRTIASAISQAVNDNSKSRLTVSTVCSLGMAFLALVRPIRFIPLLKYAFVALGKPWRKALFLDMLLYEIHRTLFKWKKPHFSTLFLNAGAHIQHHYFYNSPFVSAPQLRNPDWYVEKSVDPILEMLIVYDEMLLDLLNLPRTEIIVATGLSQKPYEELKYYYRLIDHTGFLTAIGIDFLNVTPRMTRDFLMSFDSEEKACAAEKTLASILVDNDIRLFGEIDNRGRDVFVVLSYPYEVTKDTLINFPASKSPLSDHVSFVAIKNGEHQSKGFAYFSEGISKYSPPTGSHVSELHNTVLQFFNIPD